MEEQISNRIKQAERLVRVEDGVEYLKEGLKDIKELLVNHIDTPCISNCILKDDVEDLKHTQKWVRWASKTAIGGFILAGIGVVAKILFSYGPS